MFKGCGKTSAKASIGSEKLPPRTTVRRVLLASAQCVASVWGCVLCVWAGWRPCRYICVVNVLWSFVCVRIVCVMCVMRGVCVEVVVGCVVVVDVAVGVSVV